MNAFLHYLSRRTPTIWTRYGLVLVTLSAVTLFRLVVPLDTAPFLLYLPVVFMLSVALGRGPGLLGTAISAVYAASFFNHQGAWWQLRPPEWIALIEYLLVSLAMVEVCGAVRAVLTENEAALARLSTSETNLRTIVDTVPVGILFAEAPSGRLVGRNKRMDDIVGVPTGAPRGLQNYGEWTALHGDGSQVAPNEYPVAQIIKGGVDSASLEMQYQRRDGTRKWIAVVATATRDTSGRLTGAVAAVSDIDELKRAEQAQLQLTEADLRRRAQETAAKAAEKLRSQQGQEQKKEELSQDDKACREAASKWSWEDIDAERKRGLKIAENWLQMDRHLKELWEEDFTRRIVTA